MSSRVCARSYTLEMRTGQFKTCSGDLTASMEVRGTDRRLIRKLH